MHIERIRLQGFWNKYTLDWRLDPDVNLLSGINGSGKSTLLDIVYVLLDNIQPYFADIASKFRTICIEMGGGLSLEARSSGDSINVHFYRRGTEIGFDDFHRNANLSAISTFDMAMPDEETYKRILMNRSAMRTELDFRLHEALNLYYRYVAGISKEVEKLVSQSVSSGDISRLNNVYARKNLFINIVNELFSSTRKEWYDEKSEICFRIQGDDLFIMPRQLSSGEKLLLIILIHCLVVGGVENIVFWDEPEISLHIDWQRVLIRKARELNPKGQFIIATHSPSLIYEGWESKVVNMEDLLQVQVTHSATMKISERQIQGLAEKVKEMNVQYAIKANGSLISAANVFLNK